MIDLAAVDLARFQFALTAMYHFIFVPLTIGLSLIMAIMETIYVRTNNVLYRDAVKFWGVLFGINFAIGVATGITMEFQFGTNWAYYSHYVGDIFGAPLAIEGLMAFFLEATFVGLFFFGWERLTKKQHAVVTWLVCLGTNLSAIWILVANGWMQNPVGSHFNIETLRMEVIDFHQLVFNAMAQIRFIHTVVASYLLGSMFVVSLSCYYLLKGRNIAIAKNSILIASIVGLISSVVVAYFGDAGGIEVYKHQPSKLAAMEAMYHTEEAPADLIVWGFPDSDKQEVNFQIKIPGLLGILTTRSMDGKLLGINDIVNENEMKVVKGISALLALEVIKTNPNDEAARGVFETNREFMGYGQLVKRYQKNLNAVTAEDIKLAAKDTVPPVEPLFYTFRIMVGLGFYFIFFFATSLFLITKDRVSNSRLFQKVALLSLPLPWIAMGCGWFVTEYGRQPWTVFGILPTFLSASNISFYSVLTSLILVSSLYTILLIIESYLMVKYIKMGPDGLKSKNQLY